MEQVSILVRRVPLYLNVLESALLLGGKRLDRQTFDDIGWWVSSVSLEFEVPKENYERFERNLRDTYKGEIMISISRAERAALPR